MRGMACVQGLICDVTYGLVYTKTTLWQKENDYISYIKKIKCIDNTVRLTKLAQINYII